MANIPAQLLNLIGVMMVHANRLMRHVSFGGGLAIRPVAVRDRGYRSLLGCPSFHAAGAGCALGAATRRAHPGFCKIVRARRRKRLRTPRQYHVQDFEVGACLECLAFG